MDMVAYALKNGGLTLVSLFYICLMQFSYW